MLTKENGRSRRAAAGRDPRVLQEGRVREPDHQARRGEPSVVDQVWSRPRKNRGRFDVDDVNGTVVDKATVGKRPPIITGLPFPGHRREGSEGRGEGGLELVLHALYWEGAFHTNSPVNWVSRDGLLRRISTDVHFKYYDGQVPFFQQRIGENRSTSCRARSAR